MNLQNIKNNLSHHIKSAVERHGGVPEDLDDQAIHTLTNSAVKLHSRRRKTKVHISDTVCRMERQRARLRKKRDAWEHAMKLKQEEQAQAAVEIDLTRTETQRYNSNYYKAKQGIHNQCPHCGVLLSSKNSKKRHIKRKHS